MVLIYVWTLALQNAPDVCRTKKGLGYLPFFLKRKVKKQHIENHKILSSSDLNLKNGVAKATPFFFVSYYIVLC